MSNRKSPSSIRGSFGVATLVAGTVAGIAPGFRTNYEDCTIILSRNTPAGTLGFLSAPAASRGLGVTTFTITSNNALDTSTVNWLAIPRTQNSTYGISAGGPFRKPPSGTFLLRGQTTLVGGTKSVVTGQQFSANAKAYAMIATIGGSPGKLSCPVASVNPATGTFVINSNSGSDTSLVDWIVVDEAPRSSPSGPFLYQSTGPLVAGVRAFTGADGANSSLVSIIASVIDFGGTPDTLTAPTGSRTSEGGFSVISNNGADTSFVETIVF